MNKKYSIAEKEDKKSKDFRSTTIVSEVEDKKQKDEEEEKPKKRSSKVSKKPRVSNYLLPNLVREVKQCLSDMLPADNKYIFQFLVRLFKKFKINYQVWAFDAILICLIYIRDKTEMINPKKYFAIIEAISSTLGRFREKNLEK